MDVNRPVWVGRGSGNMQGEWSFWGHEQREVRPCNERALALSLMCCGTWVSHKPSQCRPLYNGHIRVLNPREFFLL